MRMRITITAGELIERGKWDEACELLGLNVWAINEGCMSSEEEITLTEEQARILHLLPSDTETW